jgi:hypothetical protein
MSDPAAPAQGQPAEQPVLHNYRILTLNGLIIDISSPNDLVTMWTLIVRDGWVVTPNDFIPYHALAHIQLLPPTEAGARPKIVPFLNRQP